MDENQLIENIKQHDEAAMKEIFHRFNKKVYNTVLSLVMNNEEAEELTQDVFVEVFKSIDSFSGKSTLSTWIYRIAVNKALDSLKARKAKKRMSFIVSIFKKDSIEPRIHAIEFRHPGVLLEEQEMYQTIFSEIDKLPIQQRTALVLSKIEGLSQIEISAIMNLSISAIESLVFRAKQNLKKQLGINN